MKAFRILLLIIAAAITTSCGDDDEKLPPMTWKTTATIVDGSAIVNPGGEEIVFICTNYPVIRVSKVRCDGQDYSWTDWNASDPWLYGVVNDETATLYARPNNTGKERTAAITFTEGDVSTTFSFRQEPQKTPTTPDRPSDEM